MVGLWRSKSPTAQLQAAGRLVYLNVVQEYQLLLSPNFQSRKLFQNSGLHLLARLEDHSFYPKHEHLAPGAPSTSGILLIV